jgi:hypothetical protein
MFGINKWEIVTIVMLMAIPAGVVYAVFFGKRK